MSRKNRKRRPKPVPVVMPASTAEPAPLTEVERARLHQRFSSMKGRGISIGYIPCGPVVRATSPAEMIANTEAALVEAVWGEPKN